MSAHASIVGKVVVVLDVGIATVVGVESDVKPVDEDTPAHEQAAPNSTIGINQRNTTEG